MEDFEEEGTNNILDNSNDFEEEPQTEEDVQSRYFNTESLHEPGGVTGKTSRGFKVKGVGVIKKTGRGFKVKGAGVIKKTGRGFKVKGAGIKKYKRKAIFEY